MEDFERIAFAANRSISTLQNLQKRFAKHLTDDSEQLPAGSQLFASPEELQITVLGVTATARGRPIAVDRMPVAIEYIFNVAIDGGTTPVWRLYLDTNGNLFEDAEFKKRFGDFDSTYVRNQLVIAFANKLLTSVVFAPKS